MEPPVVSKLEGPRQGACPFRLGLERHLVPAGNDDRIVTRSTSDHIFGPHGLGLGATPVSKFLSYLARVGIQEQTGSQSGETSIENCVAGWGQGPYSSRVFSVETGIDADRLELLIARFEAIAEELGVPDNRITAKVLGVFTETQRARPYSTVDGMREAKGFLARAGARFRGHVQWQGFVDLCGQIDSNGVKHVSPELLRAFFGGEAPFFERVMDHRDQLIDGTIAAGESSKLLADAPAYVDRVATDQEYMKRKSGSRIIVKMVAYMIRRHRSSLGPF